jgi:hypothetical protein
MTRTDEFIGQLEGYLDDYEGNTPLPEPVRDAIRAELPSIRQRPAWWPERRSPEMNTIAKFGLAAAAVVAAALLGYTYIVAPNVGGPIFGDPTPSPTPTPPPLGEGPLAAGTYGLTTSDDPSAEITLPARSTITVPAGWEAAGGSRVNRDEATVGFWYWDGDLATVYTDPCQWQGSEVQPAVGPTVDDLANALASQADRGDAVPVDVSIGGYDGQMIELSVPNDIDFADCDDGEFRSWSGRFHQGPGQVDLVYILDVNGQRTVIDAAYMPSTSEAVRAELQTIVDSIELGGP